MLWRWSTYGRISEYSLKETKCYSIFNRNIFVKHFQFINSFENLCTVNYNTYNSCKQNAYFSFEIRSGHNKLPKNCTFSATECRNKCANRFSKRTHIGKQNRCQETNVSQKCSCTKITNETNMEKHTLIPMHNAHSEAKKGHKFRFTEY